MDDLQMLQTVALFSLVSWASGLRLYLVVFVLGLVAHLGYLELPPGLHMLQHPYVIGAAGVMLFIEFFADKIPWVDSVWDQVHTFIRIPVGALLAAGVAGDSMNALTIAAGLLGGTITAGTHFAKAGSRVAVNASPEPFSNWGASLTEDVAVLGAVWLAVRHPAIFLVLFALFMAFLVWVLPKLWRAIAALFRRAARVVPGRS